MPLLKILIGFSGLALCSCGDEQQETQQDLGAAKSADISQGATGLILKSNAFRPEYEGLELVGFYLHEDRNLVGEGGGRESEEDFLETIELARKYGPQFCVEFILFPELPSNNDLRLIQRWCELCDRHKVPWFINIRPESSKPLRFLYRNPPGDAPEGEF